ncbi:hypothetical protein BDV25DRAFT_166616 [Aspergillus avenaceus]|uniref:Uncharacterized protein n=1 Tax=Aspergillus avenaceus TaxID=36643 RepID=A0A5N6TE16_ASPAV|nr:hypothetical protein BDV25DRAFT_166616 [Aspergillus avenaceus]
MFTWTEFNFICSCYACKKPDPHIEEAMDRYNKLEHILLNPDIVERQPALAWASAQEVIGKLLGCLIRDARVAMIWIKCAIIAGYHSDIARAMCFMGKAYRILAMLEGTRGVFYRQVIKWYDEPWLMPGFGATTRGLSTRAQGESLVNDPECKDVIFMSEAKHSQYIRIGRYHRLSDEQAKEKGRRFIILPDNAAQQKGGQALIKQGKSAPQLSTKLTEEYLKENVPKGDRASNPAMSKRTVKGRASKGTTQATKSRHQGSVQEGSSDDACVDPERDLLDICLELQRQHPELFDRSGCEKLKKKREKNKQRKKEKKEKKQKEEEEEKKDKQCAQDPESSRATAAMHFDSPVTLGKEQVPDPKCTPPVTDMNPKKKKKNKGKNKKKNQGKVLQENTAPSDTPIVQDVGAKKKVEMVKKSGAP